MLQKIPTISLFKKSYISSIESILCLFKIVLILIENPLISANLIFFINIFKNIFCGFNSFKPLKIIELGFIPSKLIFKLTLDFNNFNLSNISLEINVPLVKIAEIRILLFSNSVSISNKSSLINGSPPDIDTFSVPNFTISFITALMRLRGISLYLYRYET